MLRFQIAVDDVLAVQVLQGHQDLNIIMVMRKKSAWVNKECI